MPMAQIAQDVQDSAACPFPSKHCSIHGSHARSCDLGVFPMLKHHKHDLHGALALQLSDNFFIQEKTESAGSESPDEADEKVEPMIPTSPGGLVGMFQCMDGIDALRHLRGTVWDQSTRHAGSRMIG